MGHSVLQSVWKFFLDDFTNIYFLFQKGIAARIQDKKKQKKSIFKNILIFKNLTFYYPPVYIFLRFILHCFFFVYMIYYAIMHSFFLLKAIFTLLPHRQPLS